MPERKVADWDEALEREVHVTGIYYLVAALHPDVGLERFDVCAYDQARLRPLSMLLVHL